MMSSETLAALTSASRNSNLQAFWIDAFCIHWQEPQRGATLESLGFIYSTAKEVLVVLASDHTKTLDDIRETVAGEATVLTERLHSLETDEWVNSVWTYQEVVNSQRLRFMTSQFDSRVVVDGEDFFSRIGYSLDIRRTKSNWPGLEAFKDLLADWRLSGYAERSALQVMTNLDRRRLDQDKPKNYFYSMIGSITTTPAERSAGASLSDVAQRFFRICEDRNDYSFIYTVNNRDKGNNRRWSPEPGPLRAILHWHCWGEQTAGKGAYGLSLEGMIEVIPTNRISERGRDSITYVQHRWELKRARWGDRDQRTNWQLHEDEELVQAIYRMLQSMGYMGSAKHIICNDGVFFLQQDWETSTFGKAAFSQTLRWSFGAPGVAVRTIGEDGEISPGVYVGYVHWNEASEFLLPS